EAAAPADCGRMTRAERVARTPSAVMILLHDRRRDRPQHAPSRAARLHRSRAREPGRARRRESSAPGATDVARRAEPAPGASREGVPTGTPRQKIREAER